MRPIRRRAALALPLLLVPASTRAGGTIPRFPDWVGRTALLRGDGGAARLLLAPDGTGMIAVRLLFLCRPLPIRRWRIDEDGGVVRYSRISALDRDRLIPGEARILAEGRLLWIEAAQHTADFEGFAGPESAGRCR